MYFALLICFYFSSVHKSTLWFTQVIASKLIPELITFCSSKRNDYLFLRLKIEMTLR